MPDLAGGYRARLIKDSAFELVKSIVVDLGWTAAGRQHNPIYFRTEAADNDEKVELNTIAVSQQDVSDVLGELGSLSYEDTWVFYVDLYAENGALGAHLINDIRDGLRGRLPSIGRTDPRLDVWDFGLEVPVKVFSCEIEDVTVDRAIEFPQPWQKYWWMLRFTVIDNFYQDD